MESVFDQSVIFMMALPMDIFPSWLQYPQWWAASSSISYRATRVAVDADCSGRDDDLDDEADISFSKIEFLFEITFILFLHSYT